MRIALVTIGEPLPTKQGAADRPLRTGYLSRLLADRGHDVTWWTSSFDHSRKRMISDTDDMIQVRHGLQLRLLNGGGYRKNVSIARLLDQRRIAKKFAAAVRLEPPPDVILCSLPPVELALASVKFGRERGIPVVLDMRDMWPDIFVNEFPAATRGVARLILAPLFRQAERACSDATVITGITPDFVKWGRARGKRTAASFDRCFPMGYSVQQFSEAEQSAAQMFWRNHGITTEEQEPVICFFGNLGKMFNLSPVIEAASILSRRQRPVKFVLCGTGERLDEYRALAAGVKNVLLPGWVNAAQIHSLLRLSFAGIDPLPDRYDYLATINNKAIEYLSGGVPVISSPNRGLLAETLEKHQCGASCAAGDPRALADLIEAACASRAYWDCKRANATALFQKEFEASSVYHEFTTLLESLPDHKVASN